MRSACHHRSRGVILPQPVFFWDLPQNMGDAGRNIASPCLHGLLGMACPALHGIQNLESLQQATSNSNRDGNKPVLEVAIALFAS